MVELANSFAVAPSGLCGRFLPIVLKRPTAAQTAALIFWRARHTSLHGAPNISSEMLPRYKSVGTFTRTAGACPKTECLAVVQ